MSVLPRARRALWHLRRNGLSGLTTHLRRQRNAETAAGTPSTSAPAEDPKPDTAPAAEATAYLPEIPAWFPAVSMQPSRPGLTAAVAGPEDFIRMLGWEMCLWKLDDGDTSEPILDGPDAPDLVLIATPFPHPTAAHLPGLVARATAAGIPTVLWDLAGSLGQQHSRSTDDRDPVLHELAGAVDAVFTVHTSPPPGVSHLPHGVQQALHNPVRTPAARHQRDVALIADAGSRDGREDSASALRLLIEGTVDVLPRLRTGLDTFGWDSSELPDQIPTRGAAAPAQRDGLLRQYAVGLDSHCDRPEICSRDVLEFTACGTAVITASGTGTDRVFPPEEILRADTRPQAGFTVSALARSSGLRDRMVHRAQRRLWSGHTLSHRTDTILDAVGLARHRRTPSRPTVTALVSSIRPHLLEQVFGILGDQEDVDLQVAVLAHGWEPNAHELSARANDAGISELSILSEPSSTPLGACLNRLVEASDGEVVAKIDDDDRYGPHYLSDALHALAYSSAQVVGKQAHFVHVESHNLTALRFPEREHRYTDFVMGPTIVTARQTAVEHPFAEVPLGEDSAFLRSVLAADGLIYSADRFNFTLMRTAGDHTWQADDIEMLASADFQVGGFSPAHVFV